MDAVEAHGTGTRLGDPIEAQALLATYGQGRERDRPLWLGSVKSNIGHTQAAAGVAGVIKMVMALRHERLPRTLHIDQPSSEVDWSTGAVALLTDDVPWHAQRPVRAARGSPRSGSAAPTHTSSSKKPRQEPVEIESPQRLLPGVLPWVLSGRGKDGLQAQAAQLRRFLAGAPELDMAAVARSLTARGTLEDRAVVVGEAGEELLAGLGALAMGGAAGNATILTAPTGAVEGRTAFLFTGQGAQRAGMGSELYEAFPLFRAAFDEVCAYLDRHLECSLREVVFGEVGATGERASSGDSLDGTALAQPALFALEVSLFRLLEAWGVRPDFLIGHSVGELAAAHVAGVFSLEDACRLVAARGRLMGALPAGGAMAAIAAPEAEVRASFQALEDWQSRVALAAVNAPHSVVVSGDEDAVAELVEAWERRGARTKRLRVSHAFHSPRMDAMLKEFRAIADGVSFGEPRIPVVSNLSGGMVAGEELCTAEYWVRHVRETVRFADGVAWLRAEGVSRFVELGPDGVLSAIVEECLDTGAAVAVPVLRAGHGEARSLFTGLGEAWVRGVHVDWGRMIEGSSAQYVELPPYAFQREHFWLAGESAAANADGWRYRVQWTPVGEREIGTLAGVWPVVVAAGCSDDRVTAGIVGALVERGARPVVVEVDGAGVEREELAGRLRGLLAEGDRDVVMSGVVSLLALAADRARGGVAESLALVQALGDAGVDAPLWCVTRGAVSVGAEESVANPEQALVWGLGRVAGLEEPARWGGLLDLPAEPNERAFERLCEVLGDAGGEREIAVRATGTFASRLVHVPPGAQGAEGAYAPRGTVLVTGGTGALGAHVARWLARSGAEHILLASRRGLDAPGAGELVAELESLGAGVSVVGCDVADRAQVEELLAGVPEEQRLDGVFHVAGVLDDGLLEGLTAERLDRVLCAKVDAARHLHELTEGIELSAFVLFSSIAGTLGSGGQGAYAAGNAFLDALAQLRRARGVTATSVAWGAWAGDGMAAGVAERLRQGGMRAMPVAPALVGLQQALDRGEPHVVFADVDWERLLAGSGSGGARALLGELPEVQRVLRERAAVEGAGAERAGSPLAARLAGVPAGEREREVLELVRAQAAAVLGHASAEAVPAGRAFKEIGFDSLAGVQLRNRLAAESGLRLPATLVFDHPTPAELAAHLLALLDGAPSGLRSSSVAVAASTDEPIAIVGIGCRYPGGAGSAQELWELVGGGGDAIASFPADRGWDLEGLYDPDPGRSGTCYVRDGGFLHDAGEFDAAFFGVGPREALAMDPQQRLLLEVCWEALEDGAFDPYALKGSQTGVFAGISIRDYASGALGVRGREVEGYLGTGGAGSVVSGRVAYTFGLEGPAVTVDTACSSSLVAMHLACQSLRSGECELALAGGVTVMATPAIFVEFSRQRGLAADGRCKAFADAADGTGWGEGVGMLVLERLSHAQANGRRVLGVVRGSAVNQDGASNGLTAPNGPSQQRVIMRALANAGLEPTEVDVVEAHGTGTRLGDPIEAQALLATYGQGRERDRPLWLGSVKSNIGHTQAAAGVAGVIKMVMALRHERLPRTLHIDEPSSEVDWSAGAVALLTDDVPWHAGDRPRRAGVSSFGVSGTNAHVVLEEAPVEEAPAAKPATPMVGGAAGEVSPWVVSGASGDGLRAQAGRLEAFIAPRPDIEVADAGLALASRARLEHRAVVLGSGREELLEGVRALARGEAAADVIGGVSGSADGRVAFLFTGQGAQRVGMGRELYRRYAVFRDAFDEVCAQMDAPLGRSLREVVFGDAAGGERSAAGGGRSTRRSGSRPGRRRARAGAGASASLDQTAFTQTGLFALEVALYRLVRAWGVRPNFLIGHSIGELVAAHVAGVLSLEDACRLVVARGRLMGALPAGGAMVAVQASEAEARESLADFEGRVALAAVNGPEAVVLSGDEGAVLELAAVWEGRGRRARRLAVSHAFHSHRMDGMLAELEALAGELSFAEPTIPVVSNLTGEVVSTEEVCSAGYWVRQVRETVRFAEGMRWLGAQGVECFLELGPEGVLSAMARECLAAHEPAGGTGAAPIAAAPALRAGRPEERSLLAALGQMWVRGVTVDWASAFVERGARRVGLPSYAFQRQHYWLEPARMVEEGSAELPGADPVAADFWEAVEHEDGAALAGTLELGEEEQRSSLSALLPAISLWRRGRMERSVVEGWRYRVRWQPLASPAGRPAGTWLVVAPGDAASGGVTEGVVDALQARGVRVVPIELDRAATGRDTLAQRLRDGGAAEGGPVDGVLSLLALGEDSEPAGAGREGLMGSLTLVQALGDAGVAGRLWVATSGAVSVGSADRLERPRQAAVWGLGRVARLECPERWGGLIDLPTEPDARTLAWLGDALARSDGEDELALRSAGVFVRRLVRAPLGARRAGPAWSPAGTVLLTGGTGALGGHLARWLARGGAERIVLTSRAGPDAAGAGELADELEELGARATIVACDVAEREQLQELLASISQTGPQLSAVFHLAGVLDDALIDDLTPERVERIVRPKIDAAWHLHELTEGLDLRSFVLFSSVSATLGGGGQAGYAAGNAFLDALAEYRRGRGLPGTAVAWGAWAGAGMAAGVSGHMRRRGVGELPAELALVALRQALDHDETAVTVVDLDWERYASALAATRPYRSIGEIPEVRALLQRGSAGAEPVAGSAGSLAARLAGVAEAGRERVAIELVQAQTALVLGHSSADAVPAGRPFKELGLDSLAGVELRNGLVAASGLSLPSTVAFDHPTPADLARYLLGELAGPAPSPPAMSAGAPASTMPTAASDELIAIVGMGCRYPGPARTPLELWELLASGADAVSTFPTDRGWDRDALYDPDPDSGRPGTSYVREGGFLHDAALFDAAFFGIGPREALAMSPEQRLLLEVCWEALEDGGIDPLSLAGSQTGVFAGNSFSDYGTGQFGSASEEVKGYLGTGTVGSVLSGRIAYTLGLEGPTMTINTACSSALVALHLAAGALRGGECSLALVGGVTVMATPGAFVDFSRQRALARDGRCKSFADAADGTGWGEGVGVVVVERLSEARRNGHRVLAVVRGSAVNQDGASNGLTAPNGPSQQRVIHQALSNAGLSPGEVDAVEAHGTGTSLGDPIEANALLETYGRGRPEDRPLWLGSVKSNIGHTQAAAGVAGLIKMVMALQHGVLPRTLHVDAPSRHVDWSSGAVSLLTEELPWPGETGRPRRAGISSFGISGTNAHVIVEEAPASAQAPIFADDSAGSEQPASVDVPIGLDEAASADAPAGIRGGVIPWVVSGRGHAALRAQATRVGTLLVDQSQASPVDVGLSLAGRPVLEHRAVMLGCDRAELLGGLGALAREEGEGAVLEGIAAEGGGGVAFLFTGQGAQRVGMGRELYGAFPLFRAAFDEVCAQLDRHLSGPRPLREIVLGEEEPVGKRAGELTEEPAGEPTGEPAEEYAGGSPLDATALAQPGLFALEVALYRLIEAWGVRPDFLIGHSVGELAAAHVAGVFSLEDASRLVAARGRLMGALPEGGAMVAVGAGEEEVSESLAGYAGRVVLAAVNAPDSVVISGDEDAVLEVAGLWRERGARTTRLRVSHAFHSPRMEGMLAEFGAVAEAVEFGEPKIPVVSNLTGEVVGDELCDAGYWVRHVRETVRFADGVRRLVEEGVSSFLELGPDGVLSAMVRECVGGESVGGARRDGAGHGGAGHGGAGRTAADEPASERARYVAAPLLRAGRGEARSLLTGLGEVWVHGVGVDWAAAFEGSGAARVGLPPYAFQRERYWLESVGGAGDASAVGQVSVEHPLLGAAVALADGEGWLFTGRLSLESHAWLADHVVLGSVLLPGTAFVELVLHVGGRLGCGCVRELTLQEPFVLREGEGAQVQVAVGQPDETGCRTVCVYSRLERDADGELAGDGEWVAHAVGALAPVESPAASQLDGEAGSLAGVWPPTRAVEVGIDGVYDELAGAGLEYGPAFQGLRGVWRYGEEVFAEVALAQAQQAEAGLFGLHPALLDAALHALAANALNEGRAEAAAPGAPRLPFSWSDVVLRAAGASVLRVRLSLVGDERVSMVVADETGGLVAAAGSLVLRAAPAERLGGVAGALRDALFGVEWVALTPDATDPSGSDGVGWAVLSCIGASGASGDGEDVPGRAHEGVCGALGVLQEWISDEQLADRRLVVLTRGAVDVDGGGASDLAGGGVWGLVRSAQAEHPGRFVLVDVDGDVDGEGVLWDGVVRALGSGESEVAVRAGGLLVPRLVRVGAEVDREPAGGVDARAGDGASDAGDGEVEVEAPGEGVVLITGGTGGLGASVARHLVRRRGVRELLLVSRRGRSAEGAVALEEELVGLGARVRIEACDVSDRGDLEALIGSVGGALAMVVHAAGVLDDGVIESLTAERVGGVLSVKVDGAWHLHELTRDMGLREFVMFSSAAGVFGSAGQGAYAAGNAFLDALASFRRAQGLAGTSVAWGLWAAQDGMGGRLDEGQLGRLARSGMVALEVDEGLELFDAARASSRALLVGARLDLRALRARVGDGDPPGLLRGLIARPRRRPAAAGGSLAQRLEGVPEGERARIVLELVRSQAAAVLGYPSLEAVHAERAFRELGFDSLAAVELRNNLEAASGLRLPATLVFDHPNPTALTEHLLGLTEAEGSGSPAAGRRRRPLGSGVGGSARVARATRVEEPIAIVGMSCRYPGGVSSPRELWELVAGGGDGISAFPMDRGWDLEGLYDPDPDHPGTSYAREGGFVRGAGEFDAAFFGIGPREALAMDPQQRVLLEGCWEALEDAGLDPLSLRGSATGVFAGVMYHEYASGLSERELEGLEGYLGTGSAGSVVSGRVAYALGLEGPAVSVDTACSSSLVALHWASQALQSGECELALAGGVTVLWTPGVFVEFSRQRALARDGRCKSYADAADGTGWGEGVGVLVLERLSEARRNGHRVLGVVRGSAVNQDGASNGLTSPNGPSQERVIMQALANAGLAPEDVDVVEGHGTGTTLGDPIEAQALLATYGWERPEGSPLWLGSVKSNIGHTQAAAGVAGVIKIVKALEHGVLPRTLHVDRPSTQVDWGAGAVSLLTEQRPWRPDGRPRRAGVSSFGISGTNAHVILEEAPPEDPVVSEPLRGAPPDVLAWVLSGRGGDGLRAQAGRLHEFLVGDPELDLAAVARSLTGRPALEERAVVIGAPPTREELLGGLGALARERAVGGVVAGSVVRGGPAGGSSAFLFTGQGAQRVGMGRDLYKAFPVFRAAFDEVCAHLDPHLGQSLREALVFGELESAGESSVEGIGGGAGGARLDGGGEGLDGGRGGLDGDGGDLGAGGARLDGTALAQPALFALEVALFRLLEAWGVRPDFLIGHSVGELAAAHVAGVFSLADGCRLVAARGRLMGALPAGGAMVAIAASEEEALESIAALEDWEGRVALAAVNAPGSVVVSGDEDAVLELAGVWRERGRRTRRLRVSHAFHSPRMDGMLEEFERVVEGVAFGEPRIPVVSNLAGAPVSSQELCSVEYWVRQAREPVRFAEGVRWLLGKGVRSFLELGPDAVLSGMVGECVEDGAWAWDGSDGADAVRGADAVNGVVAVDGAAAEAPEAPVALPLLRSGFPESRSLLAGLAGVWVRGVGVEWSRVFERPGARAVGLPPYAFQRERYWLPMRRAGGPADAPDEVDGALWDAVESGSVEGLAEVLGVGGEEGRSSLQATLPALAAWRRRGVERQAVDGWRYRVRWTPVAEPAVGALTGVWLVVVAAGCEEGVIEVL